MFLITLCLACSHSTAQQTREIQWLKFDFPPYEIASGEAKNTGLIDRIRTRIITELTSYQHHKPILINQNRADRLFRQGNYCHASMLKPDKPTPHIIYSKPHMTGLPHHIITSENKLKKFYRDGKIIPLKNLLQDNELAVSIPSRSMGVILDQLFQQHIEDSQIRSSASVGQDFFILIQKGRIDYTIEYPSAILEWNKNNPESPLTATPIQELSTFYPVGHIACSNTALGREIIQEVNSVFTKLLKSERYVDDFQLHIYPSSTHKILRKKHQEILSAYY